MSLILIRQNGESWHDAGLRIAQKFGLDEEYERDYAKIISEGGSEEDAAFGACAEWDILDYREENEESEEIETDLKNKVKHETLVSFSNRKQ